MRLVTSTHFAKNLIRLLKEYDELIDVTGHEFVQAKVATDGVASKTKKNLYTNFMSIIKWKDFFNILVDNFLTLLGTNRNKEAITVLMHILIFGLERKNYDVTFNTFLELQDKYRINVLEYFIDERNLVDVAQAGVNVFGNEMVVKVIENLLNKKDLILNLNKEIRESKDAEGQLTLKSLTIPIAPSCFNRIKTAPKAPLNTPTPAIEFKSKPIPKQVLKGDQKIKGKILDAHEENGRKAKELFELAQVKAFKCATARKKASLSEATKTYKIKPTKLPPNKDVVVKGNATSVLREANYVATEQRAQMEKLEALTQAAFDPMSLELLEENVRRCKEVQYLQEIETKHLKGLLSYEQAIIAKQNVIKSNSKKMEKFKKEREAIMEQTQKWRQKQEEKLKSLMAYSQNIEKAAKEAGQKLLEQKKLNARILNADVKEKLRKAFKKAKEELERKAQLIQDLRSLQRIRFPRTKKFDKTQAPSFGLLCEMSVAELEERLALLRNELQEDLKRRQETITYVKKQRQQLLKDMTTLIAQNRGSRLKRNEIKTQVVRDTPDISVLRQRLQHARFERTHNVLSIAQ